ncbi:MAG: hypothetical protein HKN30_16860 [Sulfitobacter sp.]|nr:hypothetical protein [Sulfitobacter sp.]
MVETPVASTPRTLADLVTDPHQEPDTAEVPEETREALRDDIAAFGAGLAQVFSTAGVLLALNKALEVPLADILKSAWSSSLSLQAYLDPEKHPPEESSWVSFGKHKLSSTHQPKIEVLLNGKRVGTVSFDVTLTLHITSTKLLVRDGRIWEATGTEFRGEFKAAYKGLPFIKRNIGKIKLPGKLTFSSGVRITKLPVAID